MDWRSSRETSFRYMRTTRDGTRDIEEMDCFMDGGPIEYNDLTAIKYAGSLPYYKLPDIGNDYLRVYSIHKQGAETLEVLHGTFIASAPSSTLNRKTRRGELDIYSLLQIVQDAGISEPLVIEPDTVSVSYAAFLILGCGLPVHADDSAAKLTTEWAYDAGTSKLEIVNDLLKFAGFASAGIDERGVVQLQVYIDPADRSASVMLRDDEPGCIFSPVVKHELDYFSVPNVVIAVMSNEEECLVARAENTDPLSIYSIPSRGREIVLKEEVSDIESQEALDAFAERRLAEVSSAVESVEIEHPWLPYQTGEMIGLHYTEATFEFAGSAVKKHVTLSPALICRTRLRRFVRR